MILLNSEINCLSFSQREYLDKIEMIGTENLPCSGFSHIQAIGYDATSKILKVDFKSGSVYTYFKVPNQMFQAMLATYNVGKYLNSQIIGNYNCQRFIPRYD